ncbi:hypothetical protein LXA43DRAFT_1100273 [Ganoderma leucocontextum]|nr:hypothetical protein LXA43DRAFT_1100273 [Ganoderma leucocontextum]
MVNAKGNNQYGGKLALALDDLALTKLFKQFNREKDGVGLSVEEQLARLRAVGCPMSRMSMYKLRARLGVPTVRVQASRGEPAKRLQVILDLKESDVQGRWGVQQVRQRLANKGISVTRDELRAVLHDHFEHEFDRRFPGKDRAAIPRVPLDCIGPMHQVHVDGHEKLSSQALRLGTVSLPIYGYRDLWGGFVLVLVVLPNVRLASTCAHLHLDFAEMHGAVPMTVVSDKGSETGTMIEFQTLLRRDAAPDIPEDEFKPWIQVQSKHNTPIEGFWLWFRLGEGHNIRDVILSGAAIFNSNDPLHVGVFNWLWPPLLQERLDEYREYWNNHTVRRQKAKDLPSGTSPTHIWTCPTHLRPTARDCRVNVRRELIRELRDEIGGEDGRRQAYNFVTPEFRAEADGAYMDLGSPPITLVNAWTIFLAVVNVLRFRN